jgi:hypothetical protein
MAKMIEFYIPKNFRKPLRTAVQPQLGKIIEFCPLAAIHFLRIEGTYDVHSHTNRLYAPGRFRKAVASYLPKLSRPGAVPFRATSGTGKSS